ncbi:hypothetical protein CHUAL_014084 [Chamberlinius hualienensis]
MSLISENNINNLDEISLKPYLLYLKFFGLYYDDCGRISFWKIYSALNVLAYILLFIWMVFASTMYVDMQNDFQGSTMLLVQSTWMLQSIFIGSNCYRIFWKRRFRLGFLTEWTRIFPHEPFVREISLFARKSQTLVICMVAIFHLINSTSKSLFVCFYYYIIIVLYVRYFY